MNQADPSLDYLRPNANKRRWAVAALVLALLGAVGADRYRATHQRLWVVNGSTLAVDVDLTPLGDAPRELAAGEALLVVVGAGDYEVTVSGGVEATVALRVAPSFAQRWRGRTVYVLNPAGLGALAWEEATYGPSSAEEQAPRLLAPEPFQAVDDVDLLGEGFPETTGGRRLTRLVQLGGPPFRVLLRLPAEVEAAAQLSFLEAHLAHWHTQPPAPAVLEAETLAAYRRLALEAGAADRLRATLATRLGEGSSLAYHRTHQDTELALGGGDALSEHYTKQRALYPDDARLAYLAGRLAPDARQAEADYRRAIELDAELAYAHHGLAYVLAARGDFAAAAESGGRAVTLAPEQPEFAEVRWLARLGAGEAATLLDEAGLDPYAKREARLDATTERRLLELVAVLDPGQLTRALNAYAESLGDDPTDERLQLAAATAAELAGDGPGLLAAVEGLKGPRARRFRLQGLAAEGRLADLNAELGENADPWELLLASFTAAAADDSARAQAWRDAAATAFAAKGAKGRALAQALAAPPADVDRLPLPLRDGALYCAVLAQAHPERADAYRAAAKRRVLGALAPVPALRAFLAGR